MKKISMKTIPFVLLGILLTGGLSGAVDLGDGFLDVKWGTSPAELEEFTKIYEKNQIVYYMRADKIHTINEQVIPRVIYGFSENQFFSVHMMIENLEAFENLRKYMQDKYGLPEIVRTSQNTQILYQWKYRKIKMKLKQNQDSEVMKLSVYYSPISSKVNQILGEADQENTVQFLPIKKDKKPARMPILTF